MEEGIITPLLKSVMLFGLLMGILLVMYEDGVGMSLYKKLRCKLGKHKIKVKHGKLTINKYFCQYCKTPRKHPNLTAIDGGKKRLGGNFKS